MSENRVIGREGSIPWRIPGEQKIFKTLTMHKTVVMGRKTFESLPAGLPGRRLIVVSRSDFVAPGALVARDVSSAVALAGDEEELFVGGGAQIYAELLPIVDRIHLTVVHAVIDGDTFFPAIDETAFSVVERRAVNAEPFDYTYSILQRNLMPTNQ
jgi:dihydrofolate reductase